MGQHGRFAMWLPILGGIDASRRFIHTFALALETRPHPNNGKIWGCKSVAASLPVPFSEPPSGRLPLLPPECSSPDLLGPRLALDAGTPPTQHTTRTHAHDRRDASPPPSDHVSSL